MYRIKKFLYSHGSLFGLSLFIFLFFMTLERFKHFEEINGFFFINAPMYKPIVYIIFNCFCSLTLAVFLLSRSKKIVIIFSLFMAVTIMLDFIYFNVTSSLIGFEEAAILRKNLGTSMEIDLIDTYKNDVIYGIVLCIATLCGIFLIRKTIEPRYSLKVTLSTYLIAITFGFGIITMTIGNRIAFPIPIRFPALLAYVAMIEPYNGDRDKVSITRNDSLLFDHIVWIIDESMRGDLMQINGHTMENMPFLNNRLNSLVNLGTITSSCVCSDYSNIVSISGLRENDFPDVNFKSRRNTSIFQYAKHAGYYTSFIYPLGHKNKPKGYMTAFDDASVDQKTLISETYPNVPHPYLDLTSLDVLSDIIHTKEKSFTYLIKYGAHFHYEHTYPNSIKLFQPVQSAKNWNRIDKSLLLNSYHNALHWSIDKFFEALYLKLKDKKVLIVYTSDHGQNVMDDPTNNITHCAKGKAHISMAKVPLFYTATDSIYIDYLKENINVSNKNIGSHFEIFPTILRFMNYNSVEVEKKYGKSYLDTLTSRKRIYFSGDIFGRGSYFKNVEN